MNVELDTPASADIRHTRSSLLIQRPDGMQGTDEFEDQVERKVQTALAQRLLFEGPIGEVGHIVLVVVVAALVWEVSRPLVVVPWLAAVAGATVVRAIVRRRLAAPGHAPAYVRRMVRNSVLAAGLAWGAGAAVVAPGLPFEYLALIMVVFAGLAAGATATLLADPKSFYAFLSALLTPLALGVLASGQARLEIFAVILIVLFAATMVIIYRRGYRGLLAQLETAARLELREAEAARERGFLDSILVSAPNAIVTVRRDGRILGVNPAFTRLFGYSPEEAIGADLNQLIVPPHELDAARELDAVAERGAVVTEVTRRRRGGSPVSVRASAAPVRGTEEGVLLVLYDDISDVRRAQQALREAEEQYRNLVESASDLVWKVDRNGRWVFLNNACTRIYGVPAEQLVGQPFLAQVDPSCSTNDLAALTQVLEGGELADHETRHRSVTGEVRSLSFAARPVRDTDGVIIGAHGIARDVSERAAAREALVQAREEAVRIAEAKSAFLANMSHEIRTPMNGVLGMLELLMDTPLTPDQQRSAEVARSSAEALLRIINDILDFSKIEAGHIELETIPFDIGALVDSAVRLLAPRASEHGIELLHDVAVELPRMVRGDPSRLRQVLTNLVSNAVKFTHEGEVVVTVAPVMTAEDEVVVRFAVRDTGIGIPPAKLDSIFDEFTQADVSTTRRYGGTGLGLAISRKIVRLMGGELRVWSVEGEGSEFVFTLTFPIEAVSIDGGGRARTTSLRGLRGLVVDDNPTNRRIVRGMLAAADVSMDEEANARDALAAMRRAVAAGEPYAFAVIDACMPVSDGFELADRVHGDETLATMRLMMLTSAGQRGDGQRCRELGIAAYLTKPVSRVELLEAMVAMMDGGARDASQLITRHSIEETRRRATVLLVEDNPVNQEVAAAMLRRRGHRVQVVGNGREAVRAVRGARYDVVLMDIQMPVLDGIAATKEIRALPEFAALPIVALTAHAMGGEKERCVAHGMTGYLAKPFKPHELFAAVEGWDVAAAASIDPPAIPDGGCDHPPVDLAEFRRSMREAGVEDAVEGLWEVFLHDAPMRMAALEEAMSAGACATIESSAHAFKSAARTITARELAELLQQLEDAGVAKDLDRAAALVPKVREEHEAVASHLQAAMPREPIHG